jgi:predicted ATP-binding protein involved in virulence
LIVEFFIKALFGERDVKIPLTSDYKILVADNGYGKTSILNCLYGLVSGDLSKIRKVHFKQVGVKLSDKSIIIFDKSEFEAELSFLKDDQLFQILKEKLGYDFVLELMEDTRTYPITMIDSTPSFLQAVKVLDIPEIVLKKHLKIIRMTNTHRKNKDLASITSKKLAKVKSHFPFQSLYLPTYRRVEEDLSIFNSKKVKSRVGTSINFGMNDVKESIKQITDEIITSSVEWFSIINGQMLTQLVNGFNVTQEMRDSISSPKAVEIVLERIGKNIEQNHKQQILDLVTSGDIFVGHDPLIYFVANLLKVYEQQQENDEAIQKFTTICNNYFGDKEIVYDESNVTISIIRKKNRFVVDIDSLSSGEKQIISLFALLFLQKKTELAIFFDEPELSLSMEWQKRLLPDIAGSGKCKFLFCTTHSPFIFENELQEHTVDLAEYITEL